MNSDYTSSIGFADIETTGLRPQQHRLLTMAVARDWNTDPWLVVNLADDERVSLLTTRDWLESLDCVVSWAGASFDIPFINFRLQMHGERKMTLRNHFDLKAFCQRFDPLGLMQSKNGYLHGMEAHAKALDIPTKATPFDREVWNAAAEGDIDAMVRVATHNTEDVITLRKLYERLIGPVTN